MPNHESLDPRRCIEDAIIAAAIDCCVAGMGRQLRAIVLTGSMARHESTMRWVNGTCLIAGDAEFLLIFDQSARLPVERDVVVIQDQVGRKLAAEGILVCIHLAAGHPEYLEKLVPAIYAFELKTCGKVVWGDGGILRLIPSFDACDIPREDAWRMLQNRMVEAVYQFSQMPPQGAQFTDSFSYQLVKLYLDMATSLLIFAAKYAPTYAERVQLLSALSERGDSDRWPFPLTAFSRRVEDCTLWKLNPSAVTWKPDPDWFVAAVTYAHLLSRWELAQLTVSSEETPDTELLVRWMSRQSFVSRWRGWLFVIRELGWTRQWRQWPRWLKLGWRASPRYWLYLAASELLFQMPILIGQPEGNWESAQKWERLRSRLPLQSKTENAGSQAWRRLAGDIWLSYERCIVKTRS